MSIHADILIKNCSLLTLGEGRAEILTPAYVSITDSLVRDLGPLNKLPEGVSAHTILDGSNSLVMPGLINCHTHAAMTLFRGMADDLELMTWLNDHIFPAEAQNVNTEMVYWCTKLAAAEMLLSGTTTVADGYFHEHEAALAFVESGMRAVAAQGVIDFPAPGVPDPTKNIAYCEAYLNNWIDNNSRLHPAVFCHSPYTCSPETLQKAKALANTKHVAFFIHVAETKTEIELVRRKYNSTPIEFLSDLGLLDSSTIGVHGVWLEEHELDLLHRSGAKIITCPESNMKLASGVAPLGKMKKRNITVGLGTDGCASNNDLDLFGEMDSCAKLHKIHSLDPTAIPAKSVLRMATLDGAAALGLDSIIGSVEAGKKADIIILDLNKPHLTPFYNADALVYAARGGDVKHVIIDGKLVVENGRILTFDVQEVIAQVRQLSLACH